MNDGTEALLPCELRKFKCNGGIRFKLQPVGSRRLLILIDHQRPHITHAVVAQLPISTIAVCGPAEGTTTEHQQISATLQKALDLSPRWLGKCRAVWKHQKSR